VDGTGKAEFFSTLYAIRAYPNIVNSLTLYEGVETFIFGGANLMWLGVADYSKLGNFEKDSIVAVKNSKDEFVVIAALAVSKK
jgi:predicted ribosome-associated RNA-binding protein Tma20